MRTLKLVLAMAFLSMLFGCGQSDRRYHSEAAYKRNVSSQVETTPKTVEKLRGYGVGADAELRLEYFFYTNTSAKAAKLAATLQKLGYDASHKEAATGDAAFVVTGWTTRIRMDTRLVVEWTKEMCRLGYSHDAEFDGWGTNPPDGAPAGSLSVFITDAGDRKIGAIKLVRELTGLGLRDAKDLVDRVPSVIKDNLSAGDAQSLAEKLRRAGMTVEIRPR